MYRLVGGIVLAVVVAASLGCGGGLSEAEVREIVAESARATQADFRTEIKRGDDIAREVITGAILDDRALRQERDSEFLKDFESLLEENKETTQSDMTSALGQYVYSICVSDYKTVALSVALGTMLDYLAGGESTLEEVEQVLVEGVPIDDRGYYALQSRVCGITTEGDWHLQPIPVQ